MKVPVLKTTRTTASSEKTSSLRVAENKQSVIGPALSLLGATISKQQKELDARQQKQDETQALTGLASWQSLTQASLQDLRADTPANETHYDEIAATFVNNSRNKFLESIPSHLYDDIYKRTEVAVGRFAVAENAHALKLKELYATNAIDEHLNTRKTLVSRNADSLQEHLAASEEVINTSDMSAVGKEAALRKSRTALQTIAYEKAYEADKRTKVYTSANIKTYVAAIIKAEYGDGKILKNPRSTATGPGQFIESTWKEFIQERHPELLAGDYQKLRSDFELSSEGIYWYADKNGKYLSASGKSVDSGSLRLAHFAGPGGAVAILNAAPSTQLADILSAKAMQDNPHLKGKTAKWLIDRSYKEMGVTANTSIVDHSLSFDSVSHENRVLIQQSIDKKLAEEQQALARAQEQERAGQLDDFYTGLRSNLTLMDLTKARDSGLVQNDREYARGISILKSKTEKETALQYTTNLLAFDQKLAPNDTQARKGLDELFGEDGLVSLYKQEPSALATLSHYTERAGMVPPKALQTLVTMSSNTDWKQQRYAYDVLAAVAQKAPIAFAAQTSDELFSRLSIYKTMAGKVPEDLLREMTAIPTTSEARNTRAFNLKQAETILDENYTIASVFDNFTEYFRLGEELPQLPGAAMINFFGDFKNIYKAYYSRTGDDVSARELTLQMMQRDWGYHSASGQNVLMKNPPEKAGYEPFNKSYSYIADQIYEIIGRTDLSYTLVPTTKTQQQIAARRETGNALNLPMPEYMLAWQQEDGQWQAHKAPISFEITQEMIDNQIKRIEEKTDEASKQLLEDKLMAAEYAKTLTDRYEVSANIDEQIIGLKKELSKFPAQAPRHEIRKPLEQINKFIAAQK